ncbi:MAG: restriction endonuclease subunit S [Pseudanabaena sp. ELA607]|jgi:type I restriction enzyme S subunit
MDLSSRREKLLEIRLGECLKVKHGYAFKGEFFSETGSYIVLTPGNFYEEGGFKTKGVKEKYYTGRIPDGFILQKGDLIIAMTEQADGLLGSPVIVPESNLYLHNQRLGLITEIDKTKLDKKFLYYLFNSLSIRNQIKSSANGTKIRHTSPERIYQVKAKLLNVCSQKKIANILSAYDDLIENNTRRIKILEEMAQMLYREWFVNFRFPNHENVKMVESELGLIPEGWEVKKLGDIAQEVRRGVNPNSVDPETPYFGLEHLPRKSIALSDWGKAGDIQSTKLAFKKGEILFGKIRPYFHKVGVAPVNGICSSDAIVIQPKDSKYFAVVLSCVSSEDFVNHATQTSQGTKMPRANWDVLTKYPVILPTSNLLLNQVNEFINNAVQKIQNLVLKNINLRKTRDLLLPKLITGEIDVEKLDIETIEIAA